MILHFIVDGYNVLHAIPSLQKLLLHDAGRAREQLVELVSRLTFKKKFRATIVFDGVEPRDRRVDSAKAPVHVVYSGSRSADEKIKLMIGQSKNRSWLVIISSDHEILNFARVCSCTTHTSRHFANLLFAEEDRGEEKQQANLSASQLNDWLKLFGEKPK